MSKTASFWAHKINKKTRAAAPSLQPDWRRKRKKKKKKKMKEEEKEKEERVPGRAVGGDSGERLARLSGAFVKGRRLSSGEAPKGGVAPPRA